MRDDTVVAEDPSSTSIERVSSFFSVVTTENTLPFQLSFRQRLQILGLIAFGSSLIGGAELGPVSLLPEFMRAFNLSYSQVSYVLSVYSLTVTVVGLPLTMFVIPRLSSRRNALIFLLAWFGIGSLFCTFAPNYIALLVGRSMTAWCHAAFFGIGNDMANDCLGEGKEGTASMITYSGLTSVSIITAPVVTYLGQHLGWRVPFGAMAVLGLLALVWAILVLPKRMPGESSLNLADEFTRLRAPGVRSRLAVILLVIALGYGGLIAAFNFIAPLVQYEAQLSLSSLVWIMPIYGLGLCLGNYLGGKIADVHPKRATYASLISLIAALMFLGTMAHEPILCILGVFILGLCGFSTVAPLTAQVTLVAKKSVLAQVAATTAFNSGITFAVSLASLGLDEGWGYESPCWIGAGLVVAALFFLFLNDMIKYCNNTANLSLDTSSDGITRPLLLGAGDSTKEDLRPKPLVSSSGGYSVAETPRLWCCYPGAVAEEGVVNSTSERNLGCCFSRD